MTDPTRVMDPVIEPLLLLLAKHDCPGIPPRIWRIILVEILRQRDAALRGEAAE